jgi:dynactin 1
MLRSTKEPLRLMDINAFLEEITAESSSSIDAPPWELIGLFITKLGNELAGILPKMKQAARVGQVVSSTSS